MNATEITNFFLKHRGRCFDGWTADKVFNYVLVNLVHRNVFVARDRFGLVGLAAIAWLDDAATITAKAEHSLPQFDWKGFPTDGDSILIADVAGDRRLMPEISEQVMARFPDVPRKRLFTYRRGKLVELSWKTVLRFSADSGLGTVDSDALLSKDSAESKIGIATQNGQPEKILYDKQANWKERSN